MKLLVVEDDRETALYLVKGLSESGYTVDRAGDGREGLFLATSGSYDAIVLDRMLPSMDGLAMLGALRAAGISTPALILSALGSVDDRVKGLRAGSDDYLVKPFAFSELLARLEALLRRGGATAATTKLRVADLELDLLTRTVKTPRQADRGAAARVPPARISDAQRRACRYPHDAAGARLGLSLRPTDQCHRRSREPAAAEDRQEFRQPLAAYCAWRRLCSACARAVSALMIAEKFLLPTRGAWTVPQRVFGNAQRLLRTHAFRLAALYFLVFAASVLGVLLFVYWTSADFVERQTEATLDAEITGLAEQYAQRGLSGLVQIVAARSAGDRGDGMLYLVTDPDGRPLAGNIAAWPVGVPAHAGRLSFTTAARVKETIELIPRRVPPSLFPAVTACSSVETSATQRRSATKSRLPCCGPDWSLLWSVSWAVRR